MQQHDVTTGGNSRKSYRGNVSAPVPVCCEARFLCSARGWCCKTVSAGDCVGNCVGKLCWNCVYETERCPVQVCVRHIRSNRSCAGSHEGLRYTEKPTSVRTEGENACDRN
ncbi:hypothetical protein ISCGN_030414 [Ixodes scapularis]